MSGVVRADERRRHLLAYLHASVEDLVASGVVKRSDPPTKIVSALLARFGSEVVEDAKKVVGAYARDKGGLAVEMGAFALGAVAGQDDPALGALLTAGGKYLAGLIRGGEGKR